ncbi:MAG: DUF3012 domain-containing protein [bacterium]
MGDLKMILSAGSLALIVSGCAPQVGSEAWCDDMEAKPKGDWTANEAADYTKFCILNMNNQN